MMKPKSTFLSLGTIGFSLVMMKNGSLDPRIEDVRYLKIHLPNWISDWMNSKKSTAVIDRAMSMDLSLEERK